MDDERLASELERRARSASPRADWASRDLLPAVRHEIDTRPAKVMTSRWPSLAGVAALVTALLILVVAVPRLAPQPAGPSHSQSPLPTPTTASPVSGPTYVCTGPDWEGRAIELTDHLGVIESCLATRGDRLEERTLVSEISRGVVGVAWQGPCADGARLDLWSREDSDDRPRYVLMIDSRPLDAPGDCRMIAAVTVEVTFMNAELAPEDLASDVEAHLMISGAASDATEISGGEFSLTLSAGATQYSNDDPIDIQAQLRYEGDQPTIDLSGAFSLVNGFGIEQLDGNLEMAPGWDLPCVPHRLRAGEPLTIPYEKSAGWSEDDPNADFYRDWSADPVLNLPAGTWLVTAYSGFMVGAGCSGELVQMQAAIVITVVEGPDAEPTPTPVAGTTFACPPTWQTAPSDVSLNELHPTVVDMTGMVVGCDLPDEPMFEWSEDHPTQVGNPRGDAGLLQIEWAGDPCGAAREYTLNRSGDAFVLEARSTYTREFCILPLVIHAIVLRLNAPIDASTVALRWNDSPPPSPTPSPMDPGTQEFACASDEDGSAIAFIDHSGLVVSCEVQPSDQTGNSPISVTSVDQQRLIVTWPKKHSACAMGSSDLEFWGPLTHSVPLPTYVLRVARSSPSSCDGNVRAQSIELVLNGPVLADDIEAFVSDLGSGGGNFSKERAVTDVGSIFELSLGGRNVDWAAGEPIPISIGLLYTGIRETVTLSGVRQFFGFQQLDGTLEIPPAPVIQVCPRVDHTLRSGVDEFTDFRVVEGVINDQYTEYFDEYGYDEQFRLPPGIYRLYAAVRFNVGSDCQGELVQLTASVVVHVR